MEKAESESKECIIIGDFNFDLLKPLRSSQAWIDHMSTLNFTQLVTDPTRVASHSATLIDHVFTNVPTNIIDISVPSFSISDHYPVCLTRKASQAYLKGPVHKTIEYRSLKHFNEEHFRQDLSQLLWTSPDIYLPCDCFDKFNAMFRYVLDKHAPLRKRRVKRMCQPGWINADILDAIKTRDYFKRQADVINFKIWRKKVKALVLYSKQKYYNNLVNNNAKSPRQLWKHLKEITGLQSNVQTQYILNDKNSQITDPYSTACMFNKHFVDVHKLFSKTDSNEVEYSNPSLLSVNKDKLNGVPPFVIPPITYEFVYKELILLNVSKSTGSDCISAKFLKLTADIIAPILTRLFNDSLSSGIYPTIFKSAKVIPIHKKGSKSDKSNYRPISILPVMSLVFERHVSNSLRNYLESNHLLYDRQSGFRKYHSCQTALTLLTDDWLTAMNNNEIVGTAFLDFSKAFDLVDHKILLKKLNMYNFSESTLKWFDSYLSCRTQQTYVSGVKSDSEVVLTGVPQGSVLGPVLFLIYINDLHLEMKNTTTDIFADDSTIFTSNINLNLVADQLSQDLNNVSRWCNCNKMALNTSKTKVMYICSNFKHRAIVDSYPSVKLHDIQLSASFEEKLLGVTIVNTLNWDNHVNNVIKKCNSYLFLLSRVKRFLSIDKRKLFFNAYILPHIDYCCTIWGNCSVGSGDKMIKFQKRAARMILDKDIDTPSIQLFSELKWLSFPERIKFQKAILMYKTLNGLAPNYLNDKYSYRNETTMRTLRSTSSNFLYIPKPSCELFRKSFVHSGATIWNNLPPDIRSAPSLSIFKSLYLRSKNCIL